MGNTIIKRVLIVIFIITSISSLKAIDSLKYCFTFNYYYDLSDTYDGGSLLGGEFKVHKSWYGASISYGYFNSHSVFQYEVRVEEINETLTIPFDELSLMNSGAISLAVLPIQSKNVELEILIGMTLAKAKSLQLHGVSYSYSFQNNQFTYLYKNYELVEKTHFGYQVGFNLSFFITKKFGLQLDTRIQDLSNGGTFFFVGTGLVFRL